MTHHFVSLTVKIPALLRHLREVKAHDLVRADEGALIKTAMAETFGAHRWPKPFSVRRRGQDGSYEVLAYTDRSPEDLASIYSPVPSLAEAVPLSAIRGYPLKAPSAGTELRFHVTYCPMVRTYSDRSRGIKGRERDLYTLEKEKASETEIVTGKISVSSGCVPRVGGGVPPQDKMTVYRNFLVQRMLGAEILSAQPMGFSLVKVTRGKADGVHRFSVPAATFSGALRVADPEVFLRTITTGIGRQRTYGLGMVLLGAAAPRDSVVL